MVPTYEYECGSCKSFFEVQQTMKDKPLKKCPKCKKNKLQKVISCHKAGIVFKGPGFYCNDYK
jgi:putative FmdB family regulatory protein